MLGGAEGTAALDLTAVDIAALASGFSAVTIGRTDGSGLLTVSSALTFINALVLRTAGTGSVAVDAALALGGNSLTISSGSVAVSAAGSISMGALSISADEIDFNGGANSISGTGTLSLQVFTSTHLIVLGDVEGTAALDLTATDIAALANGFILITIGASTQTGAITVNTATFVDPLLLVSAGGITLAGTLTTTGALTLTAAVTLDTNSTLASNGGNILFNNTINGSRTLAITAGSGSVTFSASIGATTALTSLAVSSTHSTGITLAANVTTTGAQAYTGRVTLADAITLAGASTAFSAALAANAFALTISADEIDFNGGTGSVSGTAALVLQPLTVTEVQVGGSTGTAALDLTVTDIAALADGFSSLTIGSASSTLYMKLDGTSLFLAPIALRTAADGSIEVMGALTAPQVTITTDGLTLAGSVTSAGRITVQPATSGRGISIISTSAIAPAATLVLRDSNLSNTTATALVLGNATTGAISLESNFSLGNTPTLHLISGSTVSQSDRFVVVNLAVSSAGAITLLSSDNDITTLAMAAATGNIQFAQARSFTVGTVDGDRKSVV